MSVTKAWAHVLAWAAERPDHLDVYGDFAHEEEAQIYTFLGVRFPILVRPVVWNQSDVLLEISLCSPRADDDPIAVWYTDGNMLYSKPPTVMENVILRLGGPAVENFWELLAHTVVSSSAFVPVKS